MPIVPSLSRSVSAVLVILLLGAWSCSSVGTGGGLAAERPVLRLTGWLDHSMRGDAVRIRR
jgi:hypothetical protein